MSKIRPSQSFNTTATEPLVSNFKGKSAFKTIGVSSGIIALGWSITIVDSYPLLNRKKKSKKMGMMLTVYVTTPTKSLTLQRSRQDVYALDTRLRSDLPGRLPPLSTPLTPITNKKRTVLATLKTFGPRKTPPSDPSADSLLATDLSELSEYLSNASNDATILLHPTWETFFSVGKDDLESVRTERRIQRTRSDITSVLGSGMMDSEKSTFIAEEVISEKMEGVATVLKDVFRPSTPILITAVMKGSPSTISSHDISSDLSGSGALYPSTSSRIGSSATDLTELMEESEEEEEVVTKVEIRKDRITIDSFEMMRVLGKGCAGKVLLVRQKQTKELFALKAIHKAHVLAHRELQHTITEQQVLKRCAQDQDQSNPFVVKLHYSFHDSEILYLVLDFHNGGDLATQLARWGRLGRDRARFYCAEIVEGVEGLHRAGVIYRDLKPENILISSEGHCVLTDFGLSKDFNHSRVLPLTAQGGESLKPPWLGSETMRSKSAPTASWITNKRETTGTFCGTAEYLAPEVLLGEPYSYEVDAWSCGTLLYEMLAGVTPFWSESHADMYHKVLHDPLDFSDTDERVFDDDTKNLLRGMLQKDPLLRMTDDRIKKHPYFQMIDWGHIFARRYVAPFVPTINPADDSDTQNFDETFLTMKPAIAEDGATSLERELPEGVEGEPQEPLDENGNDVFDGYSFFGDREDGDSIYDRESINEGSTEEGNEADSELRDGKSSTEGATSSIRTDPVLSNVSLVDESPSAIAASRKPYSQALESVTEIPHLVEDLSDEEDWDVVEAGGGGEAKNGGTLFSRGIKDKFSLRLAPSPKIASSSFQTTALPLSRTTPTASPSLGSLLPKPQLYRLGSNRSNSSGKKTGLKARLSDRSLPTSAPASTIDLANSVQSMDSPRVNIHSSPSSGSTTPSKSKGSVLKRALSFRPNGKSSSSRS